MDSAEEPTMPEMSPIKEFLLHYFMPEKCYDYFFLHFNFFHVPCLKVTLSKVMGIWIFLGTIMAWIPQIWKVLRAGSVEGLSFGSVVLYLSAASAYVAFCITQHFPIWAWAESFFMLLQIALLGFLIQLYSGRAARSVCFLAAYLGFMYLLTCPLTPRWVIPPLQEYSVIAIIAARFLQASCNHSAGHTGQLSTPCAVLLFMGSLGQCFSALQINGLSLFSLLYVLASGCSGVVLTQVLLCKTRRPKDRVEKDEGEKKKED